MTEAAVVEAAEHDTSQTPVGIKPRGDVIVVDNSNFKDYVDSKLPAPVEDVAEPAADTPEEKAKAELKDVQKQIDANNAPKDGDVNAEGDMFLHGKWHDKRSFTYRLHVQTQEKTKEADAKIADAESKAKTAKEALEKAEREASELRMKYEPPKTDEVGPEPQPDQFSSVAEFTKAIKDWTADATRLEERNALAQQQSTQQWRAKIESAKGKYPDYQAKLDAAADIRIPFSIEEAIRESSIGGEILYHIASNIELAQEWTEKVGKLGPQPAGGEPLAKWISAHSRLAGREIARLEGALGSTEKPTPKSEEKTTPLAEVSKAPAPITPLKGASAPVSNGLDNQGQFHGTFEQYKAFRAAGKIK